MDYLSADSSISGVLIDFMSLRGLQGMEELPASFQPEAVSAGPPFGAAAPPNLPPGLRMGIGGPGRGGGTSGVEAGPE